MSTTERPSFSGTVLVRCNVLVEVSGSSATSLDELRSYVQGEAKKHVEAGLAARDGEKISWSVVKSTHVKSAKAAELSIVWPGKRS